LFHHKKTKRNLIILNVLEKYVIVLKLFWWKQLYFHS
jgi:hypothetical protein